MGKKTAMLRRGRRNVVRLGRAAAHNVSDLPALQDPAIHAYLSRSTNVFFLVVALIMWSVAWPTLPVTHDVFAYLLPVLSGGAVLPVALAWASPTIGWGISVVTAVVMTLFVPTVNGWPWSIQVTHIIALLVLTAMTCLRGPIRQIPLVAACTMVLLWFAAPPDQRGGWIFAIGFIAVVSALLRYLFQSRRLLAERTEETELAQSQQAVLRERARIARDLHDVVAHRMSTVVVMAQTAQYRLPEELGPLTIAEFDGIAVAARESLDEVRQLLGVLRLDNGALAAPNPGMAEIDSLISATRGAGVAVTFTDTTDHTQIGESSALVIYRIVQESLANATRHAPGAQVIVALVGTPDATVLTVVNSVPITESLDAGGSGVGLLGMDERAKSVGGQVDTGPTSDGGFAVHAVIPNRPGVREPVVIEPPTTDANQSTSEAGDRVDLSKPVDSEEVSSQPAASEDETVPADGATSG
ncbi:sensor histidine kinase [Gordonia effusa]|nr:histidine kinase [Gordonia effusa]